MFSSPAALQQRQQLKDTPALRKAIDMYGCLARFQPHVPDTHECICLCRFWSTCHKTPVSSASAETVLLKDDYVSLHIKMAKALQTDFHQGMVRCSI